MSTPYENQHVILLSRQQDEYTPSNGHHFQNSLRTLARLPSPKPKYSLYVDIISTKPKIWCRRTI